MENLTQKVLAFQETREGLDEIVRALAPRIYRYPRRKLGWDEDACGDFYVFFQPRLVRLLTRFRDQGKPFESYLGSVMCWQLKNFARERRRAERSWGISLRLGCEETAGEDQEPAAVEALCAPALPDMADSRILALLENAADRRNLLLLVLKCIRGLSPDRYPILSELTGMPVERLEACVSALRTGMEPRERRLEAFRCRRNRAFSLSLLLESELAAETDPVRRDALSARLAGARRRMATAILRMSRVMLNPTNREIGAALGVPKGTVDSGLYWLKRKLAAVYDPPSRRLA